MIFGCSYYEICAYFLVYSFLGWIVEVIYHATAQGKIVNRGFLNGPVCPVYGFGMLALIMVSRNIEISTTGSTNWIVLFLAGMILCSAIELFAGWALDKLFHMRWWDYSKEPMNLGGYICMRFSLLWGVAAVLAVGVVHPMIANMATHTVIHETLWMWIVMAVLYVTMLVDCCLSVSVVIGLNKKMKEIDALRADMRIVSDGITNTVGPIAEDLAKKVEETTVQADLVKNQIKDSIQDKVSNVPTPKISVNEEKRAQLEQKMEALKQKRGVKRLMRAFPNMESHVSKETMRDLKNRFYKKKSQS